MNTKLTLLLQAIDTVKNTKEELGITKSGFIKINHLYEFKKRKTFYDLRDEVIEKIKSLKDDVWDIEYIKSLDYFIYNCIRMNKLSDYTEYIYLDQSEIKEEDLTNDQLNIEYFDKFVPIYFKDPYTNKDIHNGQLEYMNYIIIDIISTTITFTIFDGITANTFSVSSENEVQESQKKIVSICKQNIINWLLNYMNDNKIDNLRRNYGI